MVADEAAPGLIDRIAEAINTGQFGDGKIFACDDADAVRTGERCRHRDHRQHRKPWRYMGGKSHVPPGFLQFLKKNVFDEICIQNDKSCSHSENTVNS